jgi:Mannose-1-phosphate guanylyltransferase
VTGDRRRCLRGLYEVFIIRGKHLESRGRGGGAGVDPKNIIMEPKAKNTAPAMGWAALHVKQKRTDGVRGVFPADHLVVGAQKFSETVRSGLQNANNNSTLVTVGIDPYYPATGYGYIQYSSKSAFEHLNASLVKNWAEKLHKKLAERQIKSGECGWNGGMYTRNIETHSSELESHMLELSTQ